LLISPFSDLLAVVFWFGGILFGLVMFIKAVRLTFPKSGEIQHA
jgi:hypothetical protein